MESAVCEFCGCKNDLNVFFCKKCGHFLNEAVLKTQIFLPTRK